ncbi:uncharacterized protein LOC111124526 [Crassostrea virginica]
MEAPLIPLTFSFGHHQMEGVVCCSPTTFGDDYTMIVRQNSLDQQNRSKEETCSPKLENKLQSMEKIGRLTVTEEVTKESTTDTITDEVKQSSVTEVKFYRIPADIIEKYGSTTNERHKKKEKLKKIAKKWKTLSNEEMGFKISLFPRPVCDNMNTEDDAEKLFNIIEKECDERESLTENFDRYQEMEGCFSCNMNVQIRADRDRKVEKAHKQVKTKNCTSVKNNKGRKHLYIHHRIYKLMHMEISTQLNCLPSRKKEKIILSREEIKRVFASNTIKSKITNVAPRPPPQNLAHALDNYNAPSDIDGAIVNVLISLQHRDLTPEDYELLLRLDEQVAPKTVSSNTIKNFTMETIGETVAGELCAICMEVYEVGQTRKFLPCSHHFHSSCIEMWLTNSSVNCPIDNLPVEPE